MKFCPRCGNLLIIEEGEVMEEVNDGEDEVAVGAVVFKCQTCPYQHEITHAFTNTVSTKKKEVDDVLGGDEAWKNVDRTEAICPHCRHNEAFFLQIQIRSADEPMSTFYRCCQCSGQFADR
jgi:DNA-directed RNA polymerase III subunit RPC11